MPTYRLWNGTSSGSSSILAGVRNLSLRPSFVVCLPKCDTATSTGVLALVLGAQLLTHQTTQNIISAQFHFEQQQKLAEQLEKLKAEQLEKIKGVGSMKGGITPKKAELLATDGLAIK